MRGVWLTALTVMVTAACVIGSPMTGLRARGAQPVSRHSGLTAATQVPPTELPTSTPTQPAAPPTVPPVALPAPALPPPAQSPPAPQPMVFVLAGGGSGTVSLTPEGGSIDVEVSVSGIARGLHAVHVHRGCDGSTGAHLLTLSSVFAGAGGLGTSRTDLQVGGPGRGWTVIVYPGASPSGRPVLCAAIG